MSLRQCDFKKKSLGGSPSVPHPPQFNTSVPHSRATPFQIPKSLSFSVELRGVELRGFWCGTEGVC